MDIRPVIISSMSGNSERLSLVLQKVHTGHLYFINLYVRFDNFIRLQNCTYYNDFCV